MFQVKYPSRCMKEFWYTLHCLDCGLKGRKESIIRRYYIDSSAKTGPTESNNLVYTSMRDNPGPQSSRALRGAVQLAQLGSKDTRKDDWKVIAFTQERRKCEGVV